MCYAGHCLAANAFCFHQTLQCKTEAGHCLAEFISSLRHIFNAGRCLAENCILALVTISGAGHYLAETTSCSLLALDAGPCLAESFFVTLVTLQHQVTCEAE
eukprot:12425279-Karenia_brevis.AAC.1